MSSPPPFLVDEKVRSGFCGVGGSCFSVFLKDEEQDVGFGECSCGFLWVKSSSDWLNENDLCRKFISIHMF